jgi:hypothetical protein
MESQAFLKSINSWCTAWRYIIGYLIRVNIVIIKRYEGIMKSPCCFKSQYKIVVWCHGEQNSIVVFQKICLKAKMCYNGCRFMHAKNAHPFFNLFPCKNLSWVTRGLQESFLAWNATTLHLEKDQNSQTKNKSWK